MKNEYYEVYEKLFKEFCSEGFPNKRDCDEYYLVRIIRKSINESKPEKPLRPDAKYFLIVNFYFLIVKPINKNKPKAIELIEDFFYTLEDDIKSDIATIISVACQETKDEEISGHQIMRTIDKLWKELKTSRLEIWG